MKNDKLNLKNNRILRKFISNYCEGITWSVFYDLDIYSRGTYTFTDDMLKALIVGLRLIGARTWVIDRQVYKDEDTVLSIVIDVDTRCHKKDVHFYREGRY